MINAKGDEKRGPLWTARIGFWIIFLFLGTLIYSNTFSVPFHHDGTAFIIDNDAVRDIRNLKQLWFCCSTRFVVFLTFALQYSLHKFHVFGYHVVNLIIHLGSALCVGWLTRLTLATPAMKRHLLAQHAQPLSVFTCLVFLTHPIQTQSVTYIYQRCASLAGFFYLLSLCFYFKSRLLSINRDPPSRGPFFYALSLGFCLLALLSKENATTLPWMVLLCEIMFFKEGAPFPWKRVLPFLLMLPITPLLILSTKPESFYDVKRLLDSPVSGKYYLLSQPRVFLTYIRLLLVPVHQNLEYDYPVTTSFLQLPMIMSALVLAFLMGCAIRFYRSQRFLSFGIFWIFLTLAAESTFIPLNDLIFEHRLYLPMAGFSFFAVGGLFSLWKGRTLKPIIILLSCLVMVYSFLTYQRNKIWGSEIDLWNDAVRKSPRKSKAYINRGQAYQKRGDLELALSDYNQAIELDPAYVGCAKAYTNRGIIYQKKGDLERALSDYNQAIELSPFYADAYNNRGVIYQEKGDPGRALEEYNQAIRIKPNYAEAYNNRGVTYQEMGDFERALFDYNTLIALRPEYAEGYLNRGIVYQKKGDLERALSDYNQAIKLHPSLAKAYCNRGVIYQEKGDLRQALLGYDKAIELNPSYAKAYINRGGAHQQKGEWELALSDYKKAIGLNPHQAEVYRNLGSLYAKLNRRKEAIEAYRKFIQIAPQVYAPLVEEARNKIRELEE